MNNAQKTVKRLKIIACAGTNENKTPPADPHAGVDDLLLLKRNRAVVQLLRDEEALFDEENFERRVQPPGHRAQARIAFELRKILEFEEAESLLAYLDKRAWNFRFSLSLRDRLRSFTRARKCTPGTAIARTRFRRSRSAPNDRENSPR